jgi:hypothetical protein
MLILHRANEEAILMVKRKRITYTKFQQLIARSGNAFRQRNPYAPPASILIASYRSINKKYRVRKTNKNPFYFVKPPNYRETDAQYNTAMKATQKKFMRIPDYR